MTTSTRNPYRSVKQIKVGDLVASPGAVVIMVTGLTQDRVQGVIINGMPTHTGVIVDWDNSGVEHYYGTITLEQTP